MADLSKNLAQSAPTPGVLTTVYTVPTSTNTLVNSIIICNRGATPAAFSVSIAKAGEADTVAQYIYFNSPIAPYDTFVAQIEIALSVTDQIRANIAGALSINVFGDEIRQ